MQMDKHEIICFIIKVKFAIILWVGFYITCEKSGFSKSAITALFCVLFFAPLFSWVLQCILRRFSSANFKPHKGHWNIVLVIVRWNFNFGLYLHCWIKCKFKIILGFHFLLCCTAQFQLLLLLQKQPTQSPTASLIPNRDKRRKLSFVWAILPLPRSTLSKFSCSCKTNLLQIFEFHAWLCLISNPIRGLNPADSFLLPITDQANTICT